MSDMTLRVDPERLLDTTQEKLQGLHRELSSLDTQIEQAEQAESGTGFLEFQRHLVAFQIQLLEELLSEAKADELR